MQVHRIAKIAARVEASTAMVPVARLGPLGINVYVCQGQVEWHRHPDEDELFLVHEGLLTLETDLGNQILHAEELAVVPKGVAHRSSSPLRTVTLIVRPEVLSERTNGHRRVAVTGDEPRMEKVRLSRLVPLLSLPYHPVPVAKLTNFDLLIDLATGDSPTQVAPRSGLMLLALRGGLSLHAPGHPVPLAEGELTVLPAGTPYQLSATERTVYLTMGRTEASD